MATVIITRGKRWRGDIGAMKDISSRLARFEMRSVEKGQDCSLLERWRRATGGQPGPSTYSRLSNRLPPGTGQQPVSVDRSRQCCAACQSHFSSQHLVAKPCTTRRVYYIRFTNATQQNVTKCEIFSARHFLHRKLYIFSPPVFIMTLNYKLQHKLERGVRCT